MDGIWQVLRVVAVTAAVVVAAGWAARQAGKKLAPRGRGPHLEVLDSLSLGVQRGVFVIRAGQRALVLGVARDSVVLLSEMELSAAGTCAAAEVPAGRGREAAEHPSPPFRADSWADDLLSRRLSLRLAGLRSRISDLRRPVGR